MDTNTNLDMLTVVKLKELAISKGIKLRSGLRKSEIIEVLRKEPIPPVANHVESMKLSPKQTPTANHIESMKLSP